MSFNITTIITFVPSLQLAALTVSAVNTTRLLPRTQSVTNVTAGLLLWNPSVWVSVCQTVSILYELSITIFSSCVNHVALYA